MDNNTPPIRENHLIKKVKTFFATDWAIANKTAVYLITLFVTVWGVMLFVTVPKEQYLKLGEVVQLILPKTTNELADMVLDKVGKIVTPKCTWGQVVNGGNFEGVICDGWNYSDLKFVVQKKKPVATP